MQLEGRWRGRMLAGIVIAALFVAACGSSSKKAATSTTAGGSTSHPTITGVPGVTDSEIHFSMIATSTKSNPLGTCVLECFAGGVNAYFAYRNSQGGIYGRKLVLDTPIDDELGKGQQTALEVISKNNTLATFTDTLISNYDEFNKANWPVYSYLTDPEASSGHLNLFGTYSGSSSNIPRITDPFLPGYFKATKIAAIGYNVASSATCVDQIVDEFKGKYAQYGSVVYANKRLEFGLSNGVGPEVTAMKQAGVQLVYTCIEPNGFKTFAQELARQGLKAHMVTFGTFEDDFITQNASVLEGMVQQTRERPQVASITPARKLYNQWTAKTKANVKANTLEGWGAADLLFQGLKKAGASFDRQKLMDATNTLQQWTADGLFAPIDVGRQHQGPSPTDPVTHGDKPNCFSFLEIKSGKLTFVSPETADKPFLCWPGTSYDYTEPTAMSFG